MVVTVRARAGEAEDSYELEKQVGFLLRQAMQRHTAIFLELIAADITAVQWAALHSVGRLQTVSQNQLGRYIRVDQATIKGVIDRLRQKNLVGIVADPTHGRRILISITAEGRAVIAQNLEKASDITKATLAPLTAAEQRTLLSLLAKIG